MLNFNPRSGFAQQTRSAPSHSLRLLEPLNVLDDFIQQLQQCEETGLQLRLLLKAIADGLKADAVFVLSTSSEDLFETVGKQKLTKEWCHRCIDELLKASPGVDSQLVRSNLSNHAALAPMSPQSVAMLQISRSKEIWVVAVSFHAERNFQLIDIKLMVLARRILVTTTRQHRSADKLKKALLGLIHCLTASIDAKDPYTCGHSERVARIALRIGQQMRASESTLSDIYLAGLLHDIGKIGVKDSILQKAGPLTEEERLHVQEHAVIGDRILSNVTHLAHIRPGVRSHHERFDGKGYPDGLVGEQIPSLGRLLAVADSCDAMMSARPYRPPLPTWQIESILTKGAGTQWDPRIIEEFMACRQECYSICERGIGESVCLAVDHALEAESRASGNPLAHSHLASQLHHTIAMR